MRQPYRVLFCSRACIPGGPDAVAEAIGDILVASRRNNARVGLTGGLLFGEGCFAQALEGPACAVADMFERINCDRRHRDVTVLRAGPVARPGFASWSAGFAGRAGAGHALLHRFGRAGAEGGHGPDGEALLDLLSGVIAHEDDRLRHA